MCACGYAPEESALILAALEQGVSFVLAQRCQLHLFILVQVPRLLVLFEADELNDANQCPLVGPLEPVSTSWAHDENSIVTITISTDISVTFMMQSKAEHAMSNVINAVATSRAHGARITRELGKDSETSGMLSEGMDMLLPLFGIGCACARQSTA